MEITSRTSFILEQLAKGQIEVTLTIGSYEYLPAVPTEKTAVTPAAAQDAVLHLEEIVTEVADAIRQQRRSVAGDQP